MPLIPESPPKVISRSVRVADLGAIVTALQEDFVLLNAATDDMGRTVLGPTDPSLLAQMHSGRPAAALLNDSNIESLASICTQAAEARMPVGFVAEYHAAGKPRVLDATCMPIFEDEDATRCRYFLCTARDVASDFYRMVASNDGLPGIAGELALALNRGEFEIAYQPIFELRTGRMCGSEAQIRWNHPERGVLDASEFMPPAEQTRQINDIGEWLLRTACDDAATWNNTSGHRMGLTVPVSAVQIRSGAALRSIAAALSCSGLDPRLLTISISAPALIGDRGDLPALIAHLAALGVQVTVINGGLGFQALARIRDMSSQTLRLHSDVLRGVAEGNDEADQNFAAMLEAYRPLGMSLGIDGVVTDAQLQLLRTLGFDHVTGARVGAPMTVAEFSHYVEYSSEMPLH